MQFGLSNFRDQRLDQRRLWIVLRWVAVLAVALQLFALTFHKHSIKENSSDCVSCYITAQLPSGLPQTPVEILTAAAVVIYRLALQPIYFFSIEHVRYLIPFPHAPPLAFSFL